jgi:mersacidin/lichenicidin family type 2 lantibiotic
MTKSNLVRAWKDEEYRLSLSEAERALLAENPAGSLELTDAELEMVAGEGDIFCFFTIFIGKCLVTVGVCGNTLCVGSFRVG